MWRLKQVKRRLIKIIVKVKAKERNMLRLFTASTLKVRYSTFEPGSTDHSVRVGPKISDFLVGSEKLILFLVQGATGMGPWISGLDVFKDLDRIVFNNCIKSWKSKKRNSENEIRNEKVIRKLSKKRKKNFIHRGRQAKKPKLKIKFTSLKERKLHLIQIRNKNIFINFFGFFTCMLCSWRHRL